MSNITVLVYSYNADAEIEDSIKAAQKLTDNIIVLDQESTDKTSEIAQRSGARVIKTRRSPYVEPLREFGIKQATTAWVLILDADERLTEELTREIKTVTASKEFTHYKIPRKNIFGRTKWLKHGGWWPDYQTRLIHKPSFKEWSKEIHSTPQIEGVEGTLQSPILHFFHGDFESMVDKTAVFENIESDLLLKADKHVSTPTFFRKFFGELNRRLIKKAGFLDGKIGIIEAIYQAFSKTITYLYLYEKKLTQKKTRGTIRSVS